MNYTSQAYDVHTESVYIADAEISILRETKSNGFRLTIISRDGYTIVSQERMLPLNRPAIITTAKSSWAMPSCRKLLRLISFRKWLQVQLPSLYCSN